MAFGFVEYGKEGSPVETFQVFLVRNAVETDISDDVLVRGFELTHEMHSLRGPETQLRFNVVYREGGPRLEYGDYVKVRERIRSRLGALSTQIFFGSVSVVRIYQPVGDISYVMVECVQLGRSAVQGNAVPVGRPDYFTTPRFNSSGEPPVREDISLVRTRASRETRKGKIQVVRIETRRIIRREDL